MTALSGRLKDVAGALHDAWAKPLDRRDLGAIKKLISDVKVELLVTTKLVDLGTGGGARPNLEVAAVYREMLEIAAQLAALEANMSAFHRTLDQLMDSYERFPELRSTAELLNHMRGLRLMAFLAQKRLGDFHMELDRIPATEHGDVYVKWPIELEQAFMLGTYKKIFLAKASMPSPYFRHFWEALLQTVRGEIGSCFEAAYPSLGAAEAARLLFFPPAEAEAAFADFAAKRGWAVANGTVALAAARPAATADLDASAHAKHLLHYANMLELIP